MSEFRSPCLWVPSSSYDWTFSITTTPPPGCSGLVWNPAVYSIAAAFEACTIWIALELNVQLFLRFKGEEAYTSSRIIYFFSIIESLLLTILPRSFMASLWGLLPFSTATTLLHFTTEGVLSTVLLNIGWVAMVTGFSCVLYSRCTSSIQTRKSSESYLFASLWTLFFFTVL